MKSESLSTKVYLEIRKQILSSQLTAKTRLKEDAWAKKIGANRMAVREALNRLRGEQLVNLGESGGYYVTFLKEKDIRNIRELREILEVGAVRLFVKKYTKEKIEILEKICKDYTTMVKERYFGGALEADIKFHETIIQFAENEKLIQAYKVSHIPLFHHQLGKTKTLLSEYELTDKEHREIVKALKDHKPDIAIKWLIKQFTRGELLMINTE